MYNEEVYEKLAQEVLEQAKFIPIISCKVRFLIFSDDELNQLPEEFREEFEEDGGAASYIVEEFNGNRVYTVKFNKYGYFIEVTGDDLRALKAEFISQANEQG